MLKAEVLAVKIEIFKHNKKKQDNRNKKCFFSAFLVKQSSLFW